MRSIACLLACFCIPGGSQLHRFSNSRDLAIRRALCDLESAECNRCRGFVKAWHAAQNKVRGQKRGLRHGSLNRAHDLLNIWICKRDLIACKQQIQQIDHKPRSLLFIYTFFFLREASPCAEAESSPCDISTKFQEANTRL